MIVRHAAREDLRAVLALLRQFFAFAGLERDLGMRPDPAYGARLFAAHVERSDMCCLVLDDVSGVLMASASEHPFGQVRIAKETLWWIAPESRSAASARFMLDAYETWAREQGCACVGMAALANGSSIVGRMYERRGYRPMETHYLKGL